MQLKALFTRISSDSQVVQAPRVVKSEKEHSVVGQYALDWYIEGLPAIADIIPTVIERRTARCYLILSIQSQVF